MAGSLPSLAARTVQVWDERGLEFWTMADRDRAKLIDLEKDLKAMFKALETRPLPDRIRSVVDQLDETTPTESRKRTG